MSALEICLSSPIATCKDEGYWSKPKVSRHDRAYGLCTTGTNGDEKHLLFECLELQETRDKWASLFSGPDMHRNSCGRKFINECLGKIYAPAAGPYYDGQASDQPDVAGRYVS